MFDILGNDYPATYSWISRVNNVQCDALARQAATSREHSLWVNHNFQDEYRVKVSSLLETCV